MMPQKYTQAPLATKFFPQISTNSPPPCTSTPIFMHEHGIGKKIYYLCALIFYEYGNSEIQETALRQR